MRFTHYLLKMMFALLLGSFSIVFFRYMLTSPNIIPSSKSVSLTPLVSPIFFPPVHTNSSHTAKETTTISTQHKGVVTASVTDQGNSSAPSPSGNISLDTSASILRAALVNIICYVPIGSGLHSISGSGVIIDPKGIILTNAHVAQYFLLANRGVSCIIRSGSPATDSYNAALIFISPAWINANAGLLTETAPSGTGQYDFALLAITKSATLAALPSSFHFIPLATKPLLAGTPIVIASYGAQFLEPSQVQSSLFPTVVFGSVKNVFTFATSTIDVLALGGSVAAQEGSSGGGVANASGELAGTITTSTISGDTSSRELSAITESYIRADYAMETGRTLNSLLAEPVAISITNFATNISTLEAILVAHMP